MRFLFVLFLGCVVFISCRNDFEFTPSENGNLRFSRDTIYLDTVFTGISSSTYTLKVYNNTNNDIKIPTIKFGKGLTSNYRMTVDGMVGNQNRIFQEVELLAKDSMFIFIEQTSNIADANPNDFLYTDIIEFTHVDGQKQKVDLVTLIQDAIFIKPDRDIDTKIKETLQLSGVATNIVGHQLTDAELNWTNQKPYVIYGYALVANQKTLQIQAGTKVHFHANSGIIVDKQGTINIQGALSDYDADGKILVDRWVRFEGDRLEPAFENVPGQWGTILILSENQNQINYLDLKNAAVGILIQPLDIDQNYQTKLQINNSRIYQCTNIGLLSRGAKIEGKNFVINQCGVASFAGTFGGDYEFTHATFCNFWNSSRQVSVLLTNNFETPETLYLQDLVKAQFNNCMIYGSNSIQMLFDNKQPAGNTTQFNYFFNHCLIRFNNQNNQFTNNPLYDFTNNNLFLNCTIARNSVEFAPKFINRLRTDLRLEEAYDRPVNTSFANFNDILGVPRTNQPNLGAYQFMP